MSMLISDAVNQIKEHAPERSSDALEYYEDIRNWLDANISLLRAHLTERPHETIARIGRETRNARARGEQNGLDRR